MTTTHMNGLSLKELVDISQLIVVAQKSTPFEFSENLSILPKGSEFEGKNTPPYYEPPYNEGCPENVLNKNFPPFVRCGYKFHVLELLYHSSNAYSSLNDGEEITVFDACETQCLATHQGYYLRGVRRSPVYRSYLGSVENIDSCTENLILFLRINELSKGFELSSFESYDLLSQREAVLQCLND